MPRSLGRLIQDQESEDITFNVAPYEPRKIEFSKKYNEDISNFRSILGAPIKGALKEVRSQFEPTGKALKLPQILSAFGQEPKSEELEGPLYKSPEQFEKQIEQILPTKQRYLESGLERGGRFAPYAATGGAGTIARSLLSGLAGQAVEEFGGGPVAQTIAEIGAQGLPGLGKKISGLTGQKKELVDFARKMGLSEKQIAPLIQTEGKIKTLSPFAYKTGAAAEKIREAKRATGGIFQQLSASPQAATPLSNQATQTLLSDIHDVLIKMPAQERQFILQDFMDLSKGGFKGSDLINFYQDINFQYSRGHRHLGGLLDPVKNAIGSISPKLKNEFNLTNKLFKNSLKLSSKMRPGKFEDLMKLGRKGRIIAGLAFQNPTIVIEALGEAAGKKLATEMLTNPRFQNLSQKMIVAINKGKYAVAREFADQMLKESDES